MNRILKHTLLPAVLLIFAACGREMAPERNDGHYIELTFGSITPPPASTKADHHSRGVDDYNENLVQSVDCFFYPDGATGSPAVFSAFGRGAEAVAEGDSTVYKVKIFFTDDDAMALFGSTTSGTCQAYVICNAPLSYGSNTSVPALKELVLESDFSAQTVQGSFVMPAEEPATVTLSTTGSTTTAAGRIHVRRSAAKIQLYLKVPDEFVDDSDQTWEPEISPSSPIQVMFANGVKRGKVDGDYTVQSADYFNTYYRNVTQLSPGSPLLVDGKTEYDYTSVPFYSYPDTWTDLSTNAPALVFKIPWHIKGTTGGYLYKLYQVSPNMSGLKFESNHFYRIFVQVSSLGGADEEQTVVITDCSYVVLPWFFESSAAGEGLVPGELTTYKYLVIDVPEVELDNETTATFTYVSSSPLKTSGGVTVTKIIKYDYTNTTNPKQELTSSSGATWTTALASIGIDYSTPGIVTFTHSLDNVYCQWEVFATITNDDNISQQVHFVQNPPIYMGSTTGGNAFVNGYFAHVVGAETDKGWISTGTGSNTYYKSANADGSTGSDTVSSGSYGTLPTSTGFLTTLTQINVTSFNTVNSSYTINSTENYDYRIGDPRVPSGWSSSDLGGHLVSQSYSYGSYTLNTQAWTAIQASSIRVSTTEKTLIAPSFYVSSGWGALGSTTLTYENAQKRCATYQEGGFPAGRWRLPTEAELSFIFERQADGSIPNLFNASAYYWTSSGRLYNKGVYNNERSTAYLRCVYDCWYWGKEPVASAASKYTIMP